MQRVMYDDTEEFVRTDVLDLDGCKSPFSMKIDCKSIRLGRFYFATKDPVIFTTKGVQIKAPSYKDAEKINVLNIHSFEISKMVVHSGAQESVKTAVCIYLLRTCANYIEHTLDIQDDNANRDSKGTSLKENPYHPSSMSHLRRIIIEFACSPSEAAYNVLKKTYRSILDEIPYNVSLDFLKRISQFDNQMGDAVETNSKIRFLTPEENVTLFSYPLKNGITVSLADFLCLTKGQYLNDVIIDFYLNWVRDTIATPEQVERTYIFGSFFYNGLTVVDRGNEIRSKFTASQRREARHSRVQKWTKSVNLFEKDFIIIPINESAHWFLAIICFPYLNGPVTFENSTPVDVRRRKTKPKKKVSLQIGNTTITPMSKSNSTTPNTSVGASLNCSEEEERDDAEASESETASEESQSSNSDKSSSEKPSSIQDTKGLAIKQPVILIFDSLPGTSRSRICATLRDYLTFEYRVKMPNDPPKIFTRQNMPHCTVKVPTQDNYTDCGLFLLHYVEKFFRDPLCDFRLPIQRLKHWFETIEVTRKREDIAVLIQDITNERNTSPQYMLPPIQLPTVNGIEIDCDEEEEEEAEFEEEEDVGETDIATEADEEEAMDEEMVQNTFDSLQTGVGVSSTTGAAAKRSGSLDNSSINSSLSSTSSQPPSGQLKRRSVAMTAPAGIIAVTSSNNGASASFGSRTISTTLPNRSSSPTLVTKTRTQMITPVGKIRKIEFNNSGRTT